MYIGDLWRLIVLRPYIMVLCILNYLLSWPLQWRTGEKITAILLASMTMIEIGILLREAGTILSPSKAWFKISVYYTRDIPLWDTSTHHQMTAWGETLLPTVMLTYVIIILLVTKATVRLKYIHRVLCYIILCNCITSRHMQQYVQLSVSDWPLHHACD